MNEARADLAAATDTLPGLETEADVALADRLRHGHQAILDQLRKRKVGDGFHEDITVLNHDKEPAELELRLEAGADFAKGSRFLDGGGSTDLTVLRKVGNGFLSGIALDS